MSHQIERIIESEVKLFVQNEHATKESMKELESIILGKMPP